VALWVAKSFQKKKPSLPGLGLLVELKEYTRMGLGNRIIVEVPLVALWVAKSFQKKKTISKGSNK
jgi:hypothetical protein